MNFPYDRYPNFSSGEFYCKCRVACSHKDWHLMDGKLLDFLQEVRTELGKSLYISSALRCPDHNKTIGGANDSRHISGKAADVSFVGIMPLKFAEKVANMGWKGGIGAYPGNSFVHIDSDIALRYGDPRNWIKESLGPYQWVNFLERSEKEK